MWIIAALYLVLGIMITAISVEEGWLELQEIGYLVFPIFWLPVFIYTVIFTGTIIVHRKMKSLWKK